MNGTQYHVLEEIEQTPFSIGDVASLGSDFVNVFVKDIPTMQKILQGFGEKKPMGIVQINVGGDDRLEMERYEEALSTLEKNYSNIGVNSQEAMRETLAAMNGGFFFLGIFLGLLFTMATALIIYYKQTSEGFEDRRQFQILQKVGMSQKEIKKAIHSQIKLLFFLPLGMAIIHLCFAFNIMNHILKIFGPLGTGMIAVCHLIVAFIFMILYTIIYKVTARSYYNTLEIA